MVLVLTMFFPQGLNVKTEICNCDFSDHCYILIEILKVQAEGRKIKILKPTCEIDEATKFFSNQLLNTNNINFTQYFNILQEFHKNCYQDHTVHSEHKTWLTVEIKNKVKLKNKLYKKIKKQPFNQSLIRKKKNMKGIYGKH